MIAGQRLVLISGIATLLTACPSASRALSDVPFPEEQQHLDRLRKLDGLIADIKARLGGTQSELRRIGDSVGRLADASDSAGKQSVAALRSLPSYLKPAGPETWWKTWRAGEKLFTTVYGSQLSASFDVSDQRELENLETNLEFVLKNLYENRQRETAVLAEIRTQNASAAQASQTLRQDVAPQVHEKQKVEFRLVDPTSNSSTAVGIRERKAESIRRLQERQAAQRAADQRRKNDVDSQNRMQGINPNPYQPNTPPSWQGQITTDDE